MAPYSISRSLRIAAPPARIYGLIADYRNGHPRIVPKQFTNLRVESGSGVGAGTVIRFDVTVLGRTDHFKAIVSEPEPGRMLVETNLEPNDSVTTFIVEPEDRGRAANVTIRTELNARPGVIGAIERFITARVLPPMYDAELRNLSRESS